MRTVLVTGGARGIGRAIVKASTEDHAVSFTYNSTEPADLLTECPELHAIQADLSKPGAARRIVSAVLDKWGGLDIIINNAGVIETDDGDRELLFRVNTLAPMELLDAALPYLKEGACVVNISSVNATLPAMGAAAYSASKAAMNTWTRGMAKALGPKGIRVNGIAPGAIERAEAPRPPDLVQAFVDLTALGRVGAPEDIAKVARFLASEDAGFITGQTIEVSGGYRL